MKSNQTPIFAILLLFMLSWLFPTIANAQRDKNEQGDRVEKMKMGDEIVEALITEDGDTIILADFGELSITSDMYPTRKEQYHYYRVKRRAIKVYPYALEAIRVFRQVQEETADMKRRKRKKHNKRLQKELKKKFDAPLRKLSRYEGFVLICMIERELDQPLYDIVREARGWWTASYWNNIGKVYGFKLKEGYDPNRDPIMERILSDLAIE